MTHKLIPVLVLVLAAVLALPATRARGEEYRSPGPEPTPEETLILEYMNRMRANPQAEIERMVPKDGKAPRFPRNVDWDMFRKEMEALKPAPPLVFNLQLLEGARRHSHYMILNGLGHDEDPSKGGYTGKSFGERCKKAGYTGFASGENCYRDAGSPWVSHWGFTVDFGAGPGGMQPGRGHRTNMMNSGHREVGCSAVPHNNRLSVTHDFGGRRVPRLAGGVVFMDKNANGFYDLDEGVGRVKISADDGSSTQTWACGAYTLDLKSTNRVTLKAELGGLTFTQTFEAGKTNLKFDWIIPQKEAMERAAQALAQVDKVPDAKSPAYFAALVALHLATDGLYLDPEHRKRIDALTSPVKADLVAHQEAVLEALKNYEPSAFTKTLSEHRRLYSSTVAADWFKDAETVGRAKGMVINFEHQVSALKSQPSVRKQFVQAMEATLKELKEPALRAEMEALVARAQAAAK